MAILSQWLQFCSRRAHPSGHRADGKEGAARVQGIVVARHKRRVAELDGVMEGPSMHLVHIDLMGFSVQCDTGRPLTKPATRREAHRNQKRIALCPLDVACGRCFSSRSRACPGSGRPPLLTPILSQSVHPGIHASWRVLQLVVNRGTLVVGHNKGETDHSAIGHSSLEASDAHEHGATAPRQSSKWALLSSRSPASPGCRRPTVRTPLPYEGEHPGVAVQAAAGCCE